MMKMKVSKSKERSLRTACVPFVDSHFRGSFVLYWSCKMKLPMYKFHWFLINSTKKLWRCLVCLPAWWNCNRCSCMHRVSCSSKMGRLWDKNYWQGIGYLDSSHRRTHFFCKSDRACRWTFSLFFVCSRAESSVSGSIFRGGVVRLAVSNVCWDLPLKHKIENCRAALHRHWSWAWF